MWGEGSHYEAMEWYGQKELPTKQLVLCTLFRRHAYVRVPERDTEARLMQRWRACAGALRQ